MTIRMTPFWALYGYDASTFAERTFGDTRAPKAKEWIQEGQDILKILRENIQAAQNQHNHMQIGIELSAILRWETSFIYASSLTDSHLLKIKEQKNSNLVSMVHTR